MKSKSKFIAALIFLLVALPAFAQMPPVVSNRGGSPINSVTGANQGQEVVGTSAGLLTPSPNALHVEAFCSGGFNSVTGSCNSKDMGFAIEQAGASPLNVSGDLDARAFFGNQVALQTNQNTSIMLYGGATPGSTVAGRLFLGNVTLAIDGPAAGYFSDGTAVGGLGPSTVGTPAIIIPNGFTIVLSPSTVIGPCLGAGSPLAACTTAFPVRSLPITTVTVACSPHCVGTYTTSTTLTSTGGPSGGQNIYPTLAAGPGMGGELIHLTGLATAAYNVGRVVQTVPSSTTFTVKLPDGTSTAGCTSCGGTAYLNTPLFGFGTGTSGDAYMPQQSGYTIHGVSGQSFSNGIVGLGAGGQLWCGTAATVVHGCVHIQNVNAGENSIIEGVRLFFYEAGCFEARSGSNDGGPYRRIYCSNVGSNFGHKSTIPIYIGDYARGLLDWTVIGNNSSDPPDTCVGYDNATSNNAGGPYPVTIGEGHCEWPTDYIEIGANQNTRNGKITGHWMQNSGHSSVNGVHVIAAGNTVSNVTFENMSAQNGALSGSTLLDDINGIGCTDIAINLYILDNNGLPFYSCTGGTGVGTIGTQLTGGASAVGAGASLVPRGSGQNTASSYWPPLANGVIYPAVPTYSVNNTGGSLNQNSYVIRLTYAGPATIVPGAELQAILTSTNCASNSTCQIVVNMPTTCQAGSLPAGVTGCTVWSNSALVNVNLEKQQTANAACVNITTATCVISQVGTGSTISFPTGTGVVPSSITAIAQPDGIIPSNYMQIGDGTYIPVGGVDYTGLAALTGANGANCPIIGCTPGTFTWSHRFFINDTGAPPLMQNVLMSIHHQMGQTTATGTAGNPSAVQDRAFGVEMVNANSTNTIAGQILDTYMENLIQNNATQCAPVAGGFPWGETCAGSGRFNVTDSRTNSSTNATEFVGAHGVSYYGPGSAVSPPNSGLYIGVVGGAGYNATGGGSASTAKFIGFMGGANNTTGATNGFGFAFYGKAPAVRFGSNNVVYYSEDVGSNVSDFDVESVAGSANNGRNWFQGPFFLGTNQSGSTGQLQTVKTTLTGNLVTKGSISTGQLTAPTFSGGSIGQGGTGGSTSDTYAIVAYDSNGGAIASATASTSTANANLTATNFNFVITSGSYPGADHIGVYRTAASSTCNGVGCTNGLLGTQTVCIPDPTTSNTGGTGVNGCGTGGNFVDSGLVGDGSSLPTVNSTGSVQAPLYKTSSNCAVNSVSPAACGSAAAGAIVVPTTTTTYTVNTTAVTAGSRIFLEPMTFAGNLPSSPTCVAPASGIYPISGTVVGTSFTFTLASTSGQTCWQYHVVN